MKYEQKLLIQKRKELLDELISADDWITGSVIQSSRIQSNRKAPFNYLSRSIGGKTKTTYIASNKLKLFYNALDNGKRVRQLFNKIVEINIQILKFTEAKKDDQDREIKAKI